MLTTTSVSQDQAFQARTTPVTNLTSSHNTMASPTNTPSGAGTALKRYLIRPRNEPGSTSQLRPLSPFQRPDLKRLRRSISREGDPACQRAQGSRTTGSGWRPNGHCRVWVGSLAFCDFSAALRVRRACAGCHAEVSRFDEQIRACESVRWRHCGFSGLGPARTNKSPRLQHDCNATWFLSAMLTASVTRARQCRTRAASSRFGAPAGQRF